MQKLPDELIQSRTCYKHLAGELGVSITRKLLRYGCIEDAVVQQKHHFVITDKGHKWCKKHGITEYLSGGLDGLSKTTGQDISKSCMDHSHRVPHLAGKFGRAILSFMLARRYCSIADSRRLLVVTAQGASFLRVALGIDLHRDEKAQVKVTQQKEKS